MLITDPVPPTTPGAFSGPPVVTPPEYDSTTVDTKYVPQVDLLTHVEGFKWTVQYFSQILANDSALAGQQVALNPVYQQYRLIENFELRVSTPLTSSQDQQTKSLVMTGAANVYPLIIPNEGDLFIADIGDGRDAVFRVTLSERKSVFKDTIHTIEYTMLEYLTDVRKADLGAKTIEKFVFSKDYLMYGANPLIRTEDYDLMTKLREFYYLLAGRYLKMYTSNEYKTLLVPGQPEPCYDHFLTKFISSLFSAQDFTEMRDIRILNVSDDETMKALTIWDVIKERNVGLLRYAMKHNGLVSAKSFTQNPMLEGIYHSGIWYVVYPKDAALYVDYSIVNRMLPLAPVNLVDVTPIMTNPPDLKLDASFANITLPANPLVKPILATDFYVLSQAFYEGDKPNQSVLEMCVSDYLNDVALNNNYILALCLSSHTWNKVQSFYYIPLILTLIKASLRNM